MKPTRAAEIINDIHEGMCRASKKELMECASFYAMRSCELYQAASSAYVEQATTALEGLETFRKKYNE